MTHPLHTLKTRQQLRDYLAYTDDAYTRFINEKLKKLRRPIHPLLLTEFRPEPQGKLRRLKSLRCRWQETAFTTGYELHHIIPRHADGCDASWNLIPLTIVDHQLAHRLLYETYGSARDRCALNFRKGRCSVAFTLRAKLGHDAQRKARLGFFNPDQQRQSGKVGGKVQTARKLRAYRRKCVGVWSTCLANPMVWFYEPTGTAIVIPACRCVLPRDVTRQLLRHEPFKRDYGAKEQSLTSALTRVIKGQRKRACGWRFLGSTLVATYDADSQPNDHNSTPP